MSGELEAGERVLAQTAALFSQRGEVGTVRLLRAVHQLEFEQTDDGYVTESNWHDYYWAAVFYVEEIDRPAFTDAVLEALLPLLAEAARQNERPAVDRIVVRPLLPEPTPDWRKSLAGAPMAATPTLAPRITEVTRRRIFDILRLQSVHWSGDLDDVDFLERIYDLASLPSDDSRFTNARGDIIQHRFNNDDWDNDWVFTDERFALLRGSDDVFLRFVSEMLHPVVRSDGSEIDRLLDAFNEALGRDGYTLAPVDSISGYPVYGGRRVPITAAPSPGTPASPPTDRTDQEAISDAPGYEVVRREARGQRSDYRLDRKPLGEGGQAEVFEAVHKASQTVVAFKRRKSRLDTPKARMRREIDVSARLNGHPHYMPVLDSNAEDGWFVMPMAEATAVKRHEELRDPEALLDLVRALLDILGFAHDLGWMHRDIKPQNILLLDGRWTLADWGIVRRPRGETTKEDRTRFSIGTEGFAAPELSVAAHEATASADIYSVGRVIAWALTGEKPQPNIPLTPSPGPWRTIVRKATDHDPLNRPQSAREFLEVIDREIAGPPQTLEERAQALQGRAQEGDRAAVDELLGLAVDHRELCDLCLVVLMGVPAEHVGPSMVNNPRQAAEVLAVISGHVRGGARRLEYWEANRAVLWLRGVAAFAAQEESWDVLDAAARSMLVWDGNWDQWNARGRVVLWLRSLQGAAARVVAAALQEHPESARHFAVVARDAADPGIRHAVQSALSS